MYVLVSMQSYVDETQLYVAFDHKDPSNVNEAMNSLECCSANIRIWMIRNRPKMNVSKTEMIVFSSPRVKLPALSVAVGGGNLYSLLANLEILVPPCICIIL